ncbi:MAG: TIGR01244 family phosphatase [Rhizobiales bacterium]|nr:TIGR01244 family phosphatase [Hyphomicrobiales bacterium]
MKQVSEKLYVSPQLRADEIHQAKAKGFAATGAAENRMLAHSEGLSYIHIPIVPGQISEGHVRAFQKAVLEAGGPVLAHCKTGTRSATLYAIGEVLDRRMGKDEVTRLGQRLGLDLSAAVKWLEANGH